MKKGPQSDKEKYAVVLGLVFELVGLMVVFLYAGHYFEQNYSLRGIGYALGGLLPLGIWIFHLYIVVRKIEKTNENQSPS
jgi:hypothetical protein